VEAIRWGAEGGGEGSPADRSNSGGCSISVDGNEEKAEKQMGETEPQGMAFIAGQGWGRIGAMPACETWLARWPVVRGAATHMGTREMLFGGPDVALWERAGRWVVGLAQNEFELEFSVPAGFCKLTKLQFPNSKIYQILWGGKINKKERLSFWLKIQNLGFRITNSGIKQDLNLVWIFKGIKHLEKNLNNSSKFSLGMIFMNLKLYGIACMKNVKILYKWHLDLIW
jgi:hypothetical protein